MIGRDLTVDPDLRLPYHNYRTTKQALLLRVDWIDVRCTPIYRAPRFTGPNSLPQEAWYCDALLWSFNFNSDIAKLRELKSFQTGGKLY